MADDVDVNYRTDLLQNELEETATGTQLLASRPAMGRCRVLALTACYHLRSGTGRSSPGSDIAELLVANVEGLDNTAESQQIGQELIKLNVFRPVGCTDFQPRPGNYYFFMVRPATQADARRKLAATNAGLDAGRDGRPARQFRLDILRSALGTCNVLMARARVRPRVAIMRGVILLDELIIRALAINVALVFPASGAKAIAGSPWPSWNSTATTWSK